MKKLIVVVMAVLVLAAISIGIVLWINPSGFIYRVAAVAGAQQGLYPPVAVSAPEVVWHDEYFTIERLDERTIAIGEPRFWQRNINYLILGSERAVLFDTGPGLRDIAEVVSGLTSLPVTVLTSHLHYDHVGGHARFRDIAFLDTPELRSQVGPDGFFSFRDDQHLGAIEDMSPPRISVSMWLRHGEKFDLGGRVLQVFATPGHTHDSLMVYDAEARQLFTGDFIYPGMLMAFLPGGHYGHYLNSARMLVDAVAPDTILFPAHGHQTAVSWKTPRMSVQDLAALRDLLQADKELEFPGRLIPRELGAGREFSMPVLFPWDMRWDLD